ncbi:MAG TPA: ABC transporter permease [Solirubrobacterales bacterium]|jgi:putative spermidine/putrescine transport system permease protein
MSTTSDAIPAGATSARRRSRLPFAAWLFVPVAVLLGIFFFYPIGTIVWRSLSEPHFGLEQYTDLLGESVSVTVILRTLRTAAEVALITLVIAYPYAYAMTKVGSRARALLVTIVLLPFWTSLMARNFAWYVLEQRGGVIESILSTVGLEHVVLLGSVTGVTVAMVQVMLPYMVLPLYASMRTIDTRLLDAARSLGAPWPKAFAGVYLPLSLPGIVSGVSLVFILSLGFYITPALLGSPQEALVSQVIATRVSKLLDFAGAGAFGTLLLLITLLVLLVVNRIGRPPATMGEAVEHG